MQDTEVTDSGAEVKWEEEERLSDQNNRWSLTDHS